MVSKQSNKIFNTAPHICFLLSNFAKGGILFAYFLNMTNKNDNILRRMNTFLVVFKYIFLFSRCKGRCTDPSSPLTCRATKVRDKKVKMVMRSVLTGKEPVDRVKELVLDEHEECGCECSPELASLCAGQDTSHVPASYKESLSVS